MTVMFMRRPSYSSENFTESVLWNNLELNIMARFPLYSIFSYFAADAAMYSLTAAASRGETALDDLRASDHETCA